MEFFLNVPTLTALLSLLGAILCIYASLRLLWDRFGNKSGAMPRKYRNYQWIGFALSLFSTLIAAYHFFGTAGRFG